MADLTTDQPVAAAPASPYSGGYKGLVLVLLTLAYTLNFIDRTIIATIGQAIKVDLKLTDNQLGVLGGTAFAFLYTILGVPLARLAERWNRVSIISLAMLVWSAFTALCGTAIGFGQLLMYRVGVGFGEAGLSPSAHSLISDYFEPKKRATALSIYAFGIPLGTMFGAALGGWLAKTYGWRIAFMAVGAPGVIAAVLVKLLIREPPRPSPAPPLSIGSELAELGSVGRKLFLSWPVANMILGVTLVSFAGYGSGQFVAPYFIRAFGLDYATVGLITGLIGGFSAGVGTLVGGIATDWAGKHSARWYALVPAIGTAISAPIYIAAYLAPTWQTAAATLLLPGVFAYTYLGPTFGVVQNVVGNRQRATATALMFFILNLVGLGLGPPFIGWLIDHLAQVSFTHPGPQSIVSALHRAFGEPVAGARFAVACPGGAAPKGSAPAALGACKAALITATRQGVIIGYCFNLWGAFHYLLASFGVAKALDRGKAGAAS
jgi:predicted MFS family arabinose efflux permease